MEIPAVSPSSLRLRVGAAWEGVPMAVLDAPKGAAPASLYPLMQFLMEKNYHVLPGNGHSPGMHQLLISDFPSAQGLEHALRTEFPQWLQQHPAPEGGMEKHAIEVYPLAAMPVEDAVDHLLGQMGERLRPYAGPASSLFYSSGTINLLLSGITARDADGTLRPDLAKTFSGLCYLSALTAMLLSGKQPVDMRDLQGLLQRAERRMLRKEIPEAPPLEEGTPLSDHITHILRKYPWQVNALLTGAGTLGLTWQRVQERDLVGTVAGSIGLAAAALRMLPGEERAPLLSFEHGGEAEAPNAPLPRAEVKGIFSVMSGLASTLFGWVKRNRLFSDGLLSAACSAGFVVSGLLRKDDGLFRTSLLNLAGDMARAIGDETPAHGLDELSFALAKRPIAYDQNELARMAHILNKSPEVIDYPQAIQQATHKVRHMLEPALQQLLKQHPDRWLAQLAEGKELLNSPFLPLMQTEMKFAGAAATRQ